MPIAVKCNSFSTLGCKGQFEVFSTNIYIYTYILADTVQILFRYCFSGPHLNVLF